MSVVVTWAMVIVGATIGATETARNPPTQTISSSNFKMSSWEDGAATEDYIRASITSIAEAVADECETDDDEDLDVSAKSIDVPEDLDVSEKRRQFSASIAESRRALLPVAERELSQASRDDPYARRDTEESSRATTAGGGSSAARSSGGGSSGARSDSGRSLDMGASGQSLDILGDDDGPGGGQGLLPAYPRRSSSALLPPPPDDDELTLDTRVSLLSSEPLAGMGHGQAALRRVLFAYAMYDGDVGYCQGMNFVTAMFLTFLGEE